jgi:hypothetical protein
MEEKLDKLNVKPDPALEFDLHLLWYLPANRVGRLTSFNISPSEPFWMQ